MTARARSFAKWVGGKGDDVAPRLVELVRRLSFWGAYYEPFVGGGGVFFAFEGAGLLRGDVFLSDACAPLVQAYEAVQGYGVEVAHALAALRDAGVDEPAYYRVRDAFNGGGAAFKARTTQPRREYAILRAAQFMYLNRLGFRGLWRVNGGGKFNVPYGNYRRPCLPDEEWLGACEIALVDVQLRACDFREALAPEPGDLVYLDSPYLPGEGAADFDGYSAGGFSAIDHAACAALARDLAGRGVHVAVSQRDCPRARELYAGMRAEVVHARDRARAAGTKPRRDLLVFSEELGRLAGAALLAPPGQGLLLEV